jgi:hypothetical protein
MLQSAGTWSRQHHGHQAPEAAHLAVEACLLLGIHGRGVRRQAVDRAVADAVERRQPDGDRKHHGIASQQVIEDERSGRLVPEHRGDRQGRRHRRQERMQERRQRGQPAVRHARDHPGEHPTPRTEDPRRHQREGRERRRRREPRDFPAPRDVCRPRGEP